MKKIRKDFLSLSIIFAICLSLGLFFIIYNPENIEKASGEMSESFYLNTNGGNIEGTTNPTQSTSKNYFLYEDLYKIPNPTRTGYTFSGWVPDEGQGGLLSSYGYIDDRIPSGFFTSSNNNVRVYNNSNNGTVSHKFVSAPKELGFPNSSRVLEITTAGNASPGLGGFTNDLQSEPQTTYYQVIHAKIPEGYTLMAASNAHGNNPKDSWLTDNRGSGKFQTYVYKWDLLECLEDENFSTIGFFYLSGPSATSAKPVTWQVAYLGTFGSNNAEQILSNFVFGGTIFRETDLSVPTTCRLCSNLVALWTANTYTISYFSGYVYLPNGKPEGEMYSYIDVHYGYEMPDLPIYNETGKKFCGYYTQKNGQGIQYYDSSGKAIRVWDQDSTVTLYPYLIEPYNLTIKDGQTTLASEKLYENTLYSLPLSEKQGYIFNGWTATGAGKILESQFVKEGKTFNGTSDFVNLGREYMYTDQFLFSAWAYADDWSVYSSRWEVGIISSTEGGGWNIENLNGHVTFACFEEGVGYKNAESSVSWSSLNSGWHHFGCVFDGSYAMLFLDGTKIAQSERYTNKVRYHASNSMLIGGEAGPAGQPSYYFNGQIKNVILTNDIANYISNLSNQNQSYYFLTGKGDSQVDANWVETWSSSKVQLSEENGVYNISNAAELGAVARMVNFENQTFEDKTIKLIAHIDLAGKYWLPIAISGKSFQGTFDGNGYSIKNVNNFEDYENCQDKDMFRHAGLFGFIDNATICRLSLVNVNGFGETWGGGIVSSARGSTIFDCQVVSGKIGAKWECGGIVGLAENTIVEKCINRATIGGNYPAGICGGIKNKSQVKGCLNYGEVTGSEKVYTDYAAGIVAIVDGELIENCINYGNITNDGSMLVAGGIAALTRGVVAIESCANYGDIHLSGTLSYVGAITGKNDSTQVSISNCSSVSAANSQISSAHTIYGGSTAPEINSSYVYVTNLNTKQAYGSEASFNNSFRYKEGLNNNLPMQTGLFHIAAEMSEQNDVFEKGLTDFIFI